VCILHSDLLDLCNDYLLLESDVFVAEETNIVQIIICYGWHGLCVCNTSWKSLLLFFKKHSTNTDIHIRMSIHSYEHIHVYTIPMSTSERLNRLDLEIHEVDHKEWLVVDGDVASH
jgi:hypothetical protein